MKKMNFYTQNGWAGSNYDSKLSTKEIAAKVRAFAKKNFPAFKFSITSRWSMYADSLYIVLKSGPCVPFVEGSKLANRGRFETMSSVKDWEKDGLTPEVFAALDGVTSYASSFRYDDSDGMQDYFDTNFYLNIEIDDDYKVIDPKAKKQTTKKQEEPETVEVSVSVDGLEIVDYSEKAIAVFGGTREIKDQLKELGGKFNPALYFNAGKRAGWIFSKKQADKVRALLAPSTKSDELYLLCKEEFNDVCMIKESPEILANDLCEKIGMSCNYDKFGNNYWFTFKDKNAKDEYIKVCLSVSENPGGKNSLPEIWHKKGYTEKVMQTWWSVETYVTDSKGNCRADYNPCTKWDGKRNIINFDYMLDATPGNAYLIFEEIRKRAFALPDTPKEVHCLTNAEFYEKKVTGQRYTVNDKPDKFGCFHVVDTLDNAACDFYQTKEEAEKRAEYLNGLTDGNGRIKVQPTQAESTYIKREE